MSPQARNDAGYEGEDPDFGAWSSTELLSTVEDAVQTAEAAARAVQDVDDEGEEEAETTPDTPEGSAP
ncbi:MAG TPA: hypothetical protein VG053_00115 [Solirubrobacteraceae bacterium]|jgi:hypothetical protein|nr:hypothetical protein [Solirubrobacteraceae bacterium]